MQFTSIIFVLHGSPNLIVLPYAAGALCNCVTVLLRATQASCGWQYISCRRTMHEVLWQSSLRSVFVCLLSPNTKFVSFSYGEPGSNELHRNCRQHSVGLRLGCGTCWLPFLPVTPLLLLLELGRYSDGLHCRFSVRSRHRRSFLLYVCIASIAHSAICTGDPPGVELTTHLHLLPRSRVEELCLHFSIPLHEIVLA
jgi:hypothetical protein